MKQQIKLNSFAALSIFKGEKTNPEKWEDFLKIKGHTTETFEYMPEHLKTDLRFSFARKVRQ